MEYAIAILIISVITLIVGIKLTVSAKERDNQIELENQKMREQNLKLKEQKEFQEKEIKNLEEEWFNKNKRLQDIENSLLTQLQNKQKLSQDAFENYVETLEFHYEEANKEHEEDLKRLADAYSNKHLALLAEMDKCNAELDKIRATRDAAVQALNKEKEIKEQLSFYCLQTTTEEASDIQILEGIKPRLAKPRILSMLIWSTFYQKQMNALCTRVLGTEQDVCGIYKITNQITSEAYIGQAVDVATRWKEHAKCGLGIDTPASNKLYKAMLEYGITNFSWELLEACPREQLNEKEREYIDIYQTKAFGMNTTKGNK
jgi:hypothetical protein